MTLDEVRQMYEDATEKRLRDGIRTRPAHSANTAGAKLSVKPEAGYSVLSLTDEFSLMFWRLYPDGYGGA